MTEGKHQLAILQGKRRVRYLKIIALFKIAKAVLLMILGFSILFVNARDTWMNAISSWAGEEILEEHSRAVIYLLTKLQFVLNEGALRATGFLALFYCCVLLTEGIGVYMQQRWAEFLMIFATAAFIPVEVRHLFHRPDLASTILLLANCFIVWFLYLVLKRGKPEAEVKPCPELVETR